MNYKKNFRQFIQLIVNIYQHKLDNIILPSTLCIPPEDNFPSLI